VCSLLTGALLLWLDGISCQVEAERGSSTAVQLADLDQYLAGDDIERTEPTETPAVRSVTEARICTCSDTTA
jgi:hypothetical protein